MSEQQDSIGLALVFLRLAGEELGPGHIKHNAETIARLAALLKHWSLIANGRLKVEPGYQSLWLATVALSRAAQITLPEKFVAKSAIQLRAGGKRCMKNWLRPVKVKASDLSGLLGNQARSQLAQAREWAQGQARPEPPETPVAVIIKDDRQSRFAMLDQSLEASGFWETLEQSFSASGKLQADFRIVVKSNISMLARRSDDAVYTDPLLVRHLFLRLAERGFTNLAMIDAQNLYGGYYLNRGVGVISAHAGYAGFYGDQPISKAEVFLAGGREASFSIRDMTDEPVMHDFSGDLGKHPLGRTWTEADFRISFSKAKTHLHEFFTAGVKNVYGALSLQDKPVEYHGKMLAERLTAAMLRDFPVSFSIVDAFLTADGFYGAAWQVRPCVTKTIIASSSIIATDAATGMMMKYDPFESAFFARAVMALGLEPFRIKGEFSCFPGWRKVPRIQPFVSHNLEKYLRSPSEVSGALFTQGADKIFPLRHPAAVKSLRAVLFSTYIIRAIFDPGLASLYLRKALIRIRIAINRNAFPLSGRLPFVRDAIFELSNSERSQLLAVLNQDSSRPAPTKVTCAQADEIFWRGWTWPFSTMRPTAIFSAVELLRGIDQKLYTEAELKRELEKWMESDRARP